VRLRIRLDHLQEVVLRHVFAAHADDAGGGREVVGDVARIHRGQEFAHREVAAAAEENEVEIGNCHVVSDREKRG
jgi:hypothetical protein